MPPLQLKYSNLTSDPPKVSKGLPLAVSSSISFRLIIVVHSIRIFYVEYFFQRFNSPSPYTKQMCLVKKNVQPLLILYIQFLIVIITTDK